MSAVDPRHWAMTDSKSSGSEMHRTRDRFLAASKREIQLWHSFYIWTEKYGTTWEVDWLKKAYGLSNAIEELQCRDSPFHAVSLYTFQSDHSASRLIAERLINEFKDLGGWAWNDLCGDMSKHERELRPLKFILGVERFPNMSWLDVLYAMAAEEVVSSLRLRGTAWAETDNERDYRNVDNDAPDARRFLKVGTDVYGLFYNVDSMPCSSEGKYGGDFKLMLSRDVFSLSVEAIDYIRKQLPSDTASKPRSTAEIPTSTATVEILTPAATAESPTTTATADTPTYAENVVERRKKGWRIRFQGGEFVPVTKSTNGMFYIAFLLDKPNVRISVSDLDSEFRNFQRAPVDHKMEDSGEVTDREEVDKVIDRLKEEIDRLKKEIDRLDKEVKEAIVEKEPNFVIEESVAELKKRKDELKEREAEKEDLEDERRAASTPSDKTRPLKPTSEAKRKRIRSAIDRSIKEIRDYGASSLADHLKHRIKKGNSCIYRPATQTDWEVHVYSPLRKS